MARDTLTPYFAPEGTERVPVIVCQPALEGGMCGCEEPEPPAVCLGRECDC